MTDQSDESAARRPDVELRLPADSAYAAVLRTTAAAIAARLDFTVDDIEDLRIAVGEASALVIPEADPESDLVASFRLGAGRMRVEISTTTTTAPTPDYDSFAWQVLDTLAGDAAVDTAGDRFAVGFTLSSQLVDTAAGAGAATGAGGPESGGPGR